MIKTVNIVTFPHSITQIQDQIDFLTDFLKESSIIYQISNSISTIYPNILIEGFSKYFTLEVSEFCKTNQVKIAMVLTEHLEIFKKTLVINETKVNGEREYMTDAIPRFQAFFSLLPYVRFFIVLGHLPLKDKLRDIIKSIPIIEVPYMKIQPVRNNRFPNSKKLIDFSYQGALTKHRTKILNKIRKIPSNVTTSFDKETNERIITLQKSRFAIQIPQHDKWRYLSTMRALFCLRQGVPMINISDHEMHEFDSIFPRVNPTNLCHELNKFLLTSPEKCYAEILKRYNAFVERQPKSKLPAMIKLWADLDGSNL